MNVCLGMLAHNEAQRIRATLGDLLRQDLWRQPGCTGSLQVVVNGARDETAARARDALADAPLPTAVIELAQAGKANAWNRFVHELAPPAAEILVLADADIRLPQPDALRQLVDTLQAHPAAVAAVDEPRKDIARRTDQTLNQRLSLAASTLSAVGPPKLCGQLYAARADALRAIYLPEPMLVEDGFIKAMLVTDGFTTPEAPERLVRAEGVYHYFEAETRFAAVYRHEKRILIGTLCNILLFEEAAAIARTGAPVGASLRRRTETDPDWFRRLIRSRLERGGGRRLGILLPVPWRQLRQCRGAAWAKALPGAAARTLLNLMVAAGAAADLRRGQLRW